MVFSLVSFTKTIRVLSVWNVQTDVDLRQHKRTQIGCCFCQLRISHRFHHNAAAFLFKYFFSISKVCINY